MYLNQIEKKKVKNLNKFLFGFAYGENIFNTIIFYLD